MSGPISVHRISADSPLPEIKDHTLTLKFKLQSWGELDRDELAKMLQCVFQDWNDGRHPFDAEMITAGLARCLKRAVYHTIEKEAQDEFGHELVPRSDGMGDTSRWCLEADKRFAERKKPWINSEPEVEIT